MARHHEADASIQEYCKTRVNPGERAWFLRLTGHTMVEAKMRVFAAIHEKIFKHPELPVSDFFKFGLLHQPNNEYDNEAVAFFLWHRSADGVKRRPLGFVQSKDQDSKQKISHNRAAKEWLHGDLLLKEDVYGEDRPIVRLVHIWYDSAKKFGSAWFAVHTSSTIKTVPRGVSPISNFSPDDAENEDGSRFDEVGMTLSSSIPSVTNHDYPAPILIDKLISAHKELVDYFRLEEEDGVCEPVFLSQLENDPIRFASQEEFEKSNPTYGPAMTTESLVLLEKDYGHILANNYYKLSGIYEGPFITHHVSAVLASINEALTVLRRFRSPVK